MRFLPRSAMYLDLSAFEEKQSRAHMICRANCEDCKLLSNGVVELLHKLLPLSYSHKSLYKVFEPRG
jgi:hypothetical protein